MDAIDKKKLSNEKRLKAVQQWQKQKQQIVAAKNTHVIFEDKLECDSSKKKSYNLFEDSEDEGDCNNNSFKIRPQFEGEKGEQLLEMSSQFSERFKLDERFRDDEDLTENAEKESSEVIDEKSKNIKILESILGYEVNEKYPIAKSSVKRKLARFDPESESSSKYLKIQEPAKENTTNKESKKKKEIVIPEIKEIPISNERYIEVSSNLKDILSSTSTTFSLSQTFNKVEDDVVEDADSSSPLPYSISTQSASSKPINLKEDSIIISKPRNVFDKSLRSNFLFFIDDDDERLKEGVEFFQRKKSLDVICNNWMKNKNRVLELFRQKKKSNKRKHNSKLRLSNKNKNSIQ